LPMLPMPMMPMRILSMSKVSCVWMGMFAVRFAWSQVYCALVRGRR
jgi:hypothetical protein